METSSNRVAVFVQFTDPAAYPPLERAATLLADRGWRIVFMGKEAVGGARVLSFSQNDAITVRLSPRKATRGARLFIEYLSFLAWCRSEIKKLRPDLLYCSDIRSFPAGLTFAGEKRLKTVLHEHDPPAPKALRTALLHFIRRRFAQKADLCVSPQAERAERFQRETGAPRMAVAYNAPLLSEILPRMPAAAHDPFTLWYHGSLSPAQFPDAVVRALPRLPVRVRLEFAGYETSNHGGYANHLERLAAELGVGDRVRYLGPTPLRSDLFAAASRGRLGLVLFAREFRDPMVGASNKPFDYLCCGLPLLVNDTDEWRRFFVDAGVARACDPTDPDAIAREIAGLIADPRAAEAMAARGQEMLRAEWNYERQFGRVLEALGLSDA